MRRILLSIIFFFAVCTQTTEFSQLSSSLALLSRPIHSPPPFAEKMHAVLYRVSVGSSYFGAGVVLGSVSFLAQLGWAACAISPCSQAFGNEWLVLSRLCNKASQRFFAQMFKGSPTFSGSTPLSLSSWQLNHNFLSQLPALSEEEKDLLNFLDKRWLAKSAGFFPIIVNWVCPCFGVFVQTYPESQNCYARNPWTTISNTYQKRVNTWKESLPHPYNYPLILTRPADLQRYLPYCLKASQNKEIQDIAREVSSKLQGLNSNVILDLSLALSLDTYDAEKWLNDWKTYQVRFSESCKKYGVNPKQVICIQAVLQEGIGGIRLLPFTDQSAEETEEDHRYILEWLSFLGLTANRVELDRLSLPSNKHLGKQDTCTNSMDFQSKEALTSSFNALHQKWKSPNPQKTLMFNGTMQVLKGLLKELSEKRWGEVMQCPTRSMIAQFSLLKIQRQLSTLIQQVDDLSFFDTMSQIEQVHADLTSLLEVFSPYSAKDFPSIYSQLLTTVPEKLKSIVSCGLHAAGMTSLVGIYKAVEDMVSGPFHILYGENAYFECIKTAKWLSTNTSIEKATEDDWKRADLLLVQFNPALKRIDLLDTEYQLEKVEEYIYKSLGCRKEKPLVVAVDCTFDFIDSRRVSQLLEVFQQEIEAGILNIICYRSGLKFDLFGMDNYCGAPFCMIHNQDPKWAAFDFLVKDLALQTDPLSVNWFCLAYKNAAPELELYRKQIFDNTRALFNKIPARLFEKGSAYRVMPVSDDIDLTFVDVKVSGLFSQIRGSVLAGGLLYLRCMEQGYPIFYRRSVGFYHSNFSMLFCKENATIRLTLGLDPAEIDSLAETFEILDTLNDSPSQFFNSKLMDLSRRLN